MTMCSDCGEMKAVLMCDECKALLCDDCAGYDHECFADQVDAFSEDLVDELYVDIPKKAKGAKKR